MDLTRSSRGLPDPSQGGEIHDARSGGGGDDRPAAAWSAGHQANATTVSATRLLLALLAPTLLAAGGLGILGNLPATFCLYLIGGCLAGPWLLLGARPLAAGGGLRFRPPRTVRWFRSDLPLVLLFGPVFLVIYRLVRPWLGDMSDYRARLVALGLDLGDPLASGLVFLALNALVEEWWWRGQATPHCCAIWGRGAGLALAGAGFGLYHLVVLVALFPLPLALLRAGLITAAAFWWSHLAMRWQSWRAVLAAHLAADLAIVILFALMILPQ